MKKLILRFLVVIMGVIMLTACSGYDYQTIDMYVGDTMQLIPKEAEDDNGKITYSWTSTNEDIISVDQEGNIDALAFGESTVTATGDNETDEQEAYEYEWDITVTYNNTKAKLSEDNISLTEGETKTITIKGTDDPNIEWSEGNEVIDIKDGEITALAPGKSNFFATLSDGTSLEGNVYVMFDNSKATLEESKVTIAEGEYYSLYVNNSSQEPYWSSEDENIVKIVDSDEGRIQGVNKGKTIVICELDNKTLKCNVKVVEENNSSSESEEVMGIDKSKTYVINRRSKIIHYSNCSYVDKMDDSYATSTNDKSNYSNYKSCTRCGA